MQTLAGQHFLQSLGYAIIHSLGQMALLWLICQLLNTALRLQPRQRYTLAASAQGIGLILFIGTLCSAYYMPILPTSFHFFDHITLANQLSIRAATLMPWLSVVYLVLLVCFVARWLFAFRFAKRITTRQLEKAPVQWRLFVQRIAAQMGIRQPVTVFLSHLADAPMTAGYFKPVILIPLACINHLTAEQMEAVLLHELAHIQRYDYLLNLLLTAIETILFFNPFIWLLGKDIRLQREICCDEAVTSHYQYNKASYAGALVQLATTSAPVAQPSLGLYAAAKGMLALRIGHMVGNRANPMKYNKRPLLWLLPALVAVVFVTTLPSRTQAPTVNALQWLAQKTGSRSIAASGTSEQKGIADAASSTFYPVAYKETTAASTNTATPTQENNTLSNAPVEATIETSPSANDTLTWMIRNMMSSIVQLPANEQQAVITQWQQQLPLLIAQLEQRSSTAPANDRTTRLMQQLTGINNQLQQLVPTETAGFASAVHRSGEIPLFVRPVKATIVTDSCTITDSSRAIVDQLIVIDIPQAVHDTVPVIVNGKVIKQAKL